MRRLEGQAALVTGACGGLGSTIAAGLAHEGARLVLHDIAADPPEALMAEIREIGTDVTYVSGDARDTAAVDDLVEQAVAIAGTLHVLVNNAGIMNTTSFLDLTVEEWDAVLETNLRGYFLIGQRVARHMAEHGYGRIVNVSSTRQVQALPGNAAYCASKGGIYMLTRVMAVELAPHGVCVNAVAPGTIRTGLNETYLADPEFEVQRIAQIPARRLGQAADLMGAVTLLASPDAEFMVGANIMVDGGQTLW